VVETAGYLVRYSPVLCGDKCDVMRMPNCTAKRMTLTKVLSGLAVAIVVAGVVAGFSDMRRYIRISTM